MIIDGIEICGVKKESEKFIKSWFEETDIISFINEMSITTIRDYAIYGCYPWDYKKETELNMKHQGFLK